MAKNSNTKNFVLRSKFNDHMLSFKSRVDKGLDRFYETNKDRMPSTVRRYVEALDDKKRITPLEAQQRAFSQLKDAKSVEDIKKAKECYDNLIQELLLTLEAKLKSAFMLPANSSFENKMSLASVIKVPR